MKCTVIGAGNAGRPVARILNHVVGELVTLRQIITRPVQMMEAH